MPYLKPVSRLGQAPPPTVKTASIPGSVGGVNALDSLMMMPPQDCIYAFNLMPVEYGMRLRRGYEVWTTGAVGDVRTLIPYESSSQDPAKDRLFAVTNQGIFDVTISGTGASGNIVSETGDQLITEDGNNIVMEGYVAPTQDVTFGLTIDPAGYGVYTEWTNDASAHYLFYADGINGLYQYTEATGWTVPTGWTYNPTNLTVPIPIPMGDICFIMAYKLRLWIIFENSDDAWYSPVASVAGEFKKFTFGAKMPKGGFLVGLWSWSLDGGSGQDDYLVGVSRGGDLLVYKGTDPELPDWSQVGAWFIGQTTRSRKCVVSHGSDLYILSTYGITSLRDLLQGSVANEDRTSPSGKINRFLREDVSSGADRYDWQMVAYPGDGFLQIVTPEPYNTPYIQYNQNTSTKAWGMWENVPMLCGETWNGGYYMGGKGGTIYIYQGTQDIDVPVAFRVLSSFQASDNPTSYKRCSIIRAIGVVSGSTSVALTAVFDYNISQSLNVPLVIPPDLVSSLWNSAIWDQSKWDSTSDRSGSRTSGMLGMGRVMAIGMTGSSNSRITLAGWDVAYTEGGFL